MYLDLCVTVTKENAEQIKEVIKILDSINAISHYASKDFTDILNEFTSIMD